MSNMDSGVDTTVTKRRHPNKTSTCTKTGRVPFGNQPKKSLPQPTLTYHYNMDINQINQGDQKQASYPIQQHQHKAWKAMFYTLIEIIAVNSFTVSAFSYIPNEKKYTNHLAFREALYEGLLAHTKPEAVITNTVGVAGTADTAGTVGAADAAGVADTVGAADSVRLHQRVKMKRAPCVICKQAAAEERRGIKGIRRQALQAIAPNIMYKRKERRVTRTRVGCYLCKVALCRERGCWEAFHSGANSGGPSA